MMSCKRNDLRPLLILLALIFGAVLLLLPASSSASPRRPADNVGTELERTTRIIEHTEGVLAELGEPAEELDKAREMQKEARTAFDDGDEDKARALTLEARHLAVSLIGPPPGRGDGRRAVERELRTTDERLKRLHNRFGDDGPPQPMAPHWRDLRERQEGAWKMYRGNRLRGALRSTLDVRNGLGRMHRGGDGPPPGERHQVLEEEVARLAHGIDRLAELINGNNPRAKEQLELARAAQIAAAGALSEGDTDRARQHLRSAKETVAMLTRDVARDMKDEDFEKLFDDADKRLEKATAAAGDEPARMVRRMLAAADEALSRAKWTAVAGHNRAALLHLHRALTALDELSEIGIP